MAEARLILDGEAVTSLRVQVGASSLAARTVCADALLYASDARRTPGGTVLGTPFPTEAGWGAVLYGLAPTDRAASALAAALHLALEGHGPTLEGLSAAERTEVGRLALRAVVYAVVSREAAWLRGFYSPIDAGLWHRHRNDAAAVVALPEGTLLHFKTYGEGPLSPMRKRGQALALQVGVQWRAAWRTLTATPQWIETKEP